MDYFLEWIFEGIGQATTQRRKSFGSQVAQWAPCLEVEFEAERV